MKPLERKMPSGKILKFWEENDAPMFAECQGCGWSGEYEEAIISGSPAREYCPRCNNEKIGVGIMCPTCLSPNRRESQTAYLVEEKAWPCEECQEKLGISLDHGDPEEEYSEEIHGIDCKGKEKLWENQS